MIKTIHIFDMDGTFCDNVEDMGDYSKVEPDINKIMNILKLVI